MKRALTSLLAVFALLLSSAAPSMAAETSTAAEPVTIVHTERVDAGPYQLTVGFSRWPIRAQQSLDYTFAVDGGREGLSGVVDAGLTDGSADGAEQWRLARHPREPEVWGMDIEALDAEGPHTFRFTVDGPQGQGVGELTDIPVLAQPGPPLALSWSVGTFPLLMFLVFMAVAWRRAPRSRAELAPA